MIIQKIILLTTSNSTMLDKYPAKLCKIFIIIANLNFRVFVKTPMC
jgi:hypothetical protein